MHRRTLFLIASFSLAAAYVATAAPLYAQETDARAIEPRALLERARNVIFDQKADDKARRTELEEKRRERADEIEKKEAGLRDRAQKILQEDREDAAIVTDQRERKLEEKRLQLEERARSLEEKIAERRERLEARLEERLARYLSHLEEKMHAAVERLETLADRIDSRIEKFNERGIDTTEAEAKLAEARAAIADAAAALTDALADAREALASETPRSFGKVVATLAGAKEHLREAHQALIEVVRILKASAETSAENETGIENEN